MPSLLSDDFADKLKAQYLELTRRTENLERQLRSAYRPTLREDFVLMQASSGNALPAVTASTTGIVPGTVTDAKMLTIDSSGNAVRNTSGRSFEVFNIGGEIAAGKPFWAHREFKTGKWVANGAAAGSGSKVWGLRSGSVVMSTSNLASSVWTLDGWRQPAGSSEFDFVSWSTAGSTSILTLLKAGWYHCHQSNAFQLIGNATGGNWTFFSGYSFWQIHTAITSGYGSTDIVDRTAVRHAILIPPSSMSTIGSIGSNEGFTNNNAKSWLMRCSSGAQFTPRAAFVATLGAGSFGKTQITRSDIQISYVDEGIGKLWG